MQYRFDSQDFLQNQRVAKYDLCFAYGRTPHNFRKEILNFMWVEPLPRYYSAQEVEIIQQNLGKLSRFDFENAQERVKNYLKKLRNKAKKRKFNS